MIVIDVGGGLQKGLLDPFDFNSWFTASIEWWQEFQKLRCDRSSLSQVEMGSLMRQANIAVSQPRNTIFLAGNV